MKKFTFRNVLDGLRSSVSQPPTSSKPEQAVILETLRPEFFQVSKTVRHGFPFQPTCVAFDPIQKLLAIGTKHGNIRLLGRPGVDIHLQHETEAAVLQTVFLANEGALVSATRDDSLHLWNFRQKKPEVVHSLKFQREKITYIHLPFQSKFLYVGTERGNIHVVNIEVFQLSGYVINWNKAIEISQKTHPGAVVHLSDCPVDPSKLLIGYEAGQIVIWDLRTRTADCRYRSSEPLRSITWHHEGKQFMCSHMDGSLTTWTVRQTSPKPLTTIFPHAKTNKEGKPETCKPIYHVEWTCSKNGDSFVIFSGGLTNDRAGRTPSITVINGKATTVLEMEHTVVDFITLCEAPWSYDFAEPYGLVVLLHNDLVVVDLQSPGYPCFENPYAMDLHEVPVTCCTYIADCPADLIPALYCVGAKSQKRAGFSDKEWPVSGGEWGSTSCSYSEMIVTGHADGTIKFWDASSVSFQILYKLKTAKVFEKPRTKSIDGDQDPFAIQHLALCPESRVLCIAGNASHIVTFKYCKHETPGEVSCLEIPIVYEAYESAEVSPDYEYPPHQNLQGSVDFFVPLHVKGGIQKKAPGFQAELVCLTPWVNGEPPSPISACSINSSYGLISYGNENGLVIVDYVQKLCLLNMGTPELYGTADPYQRAPRSPKKADSNKEEERSKSPSSDQNDISTNTSPRIGKDDSSPAVSNRKLKSTKWEETSRANKNLPGKATLDDQLKIESKIDIKKFLGRKESKGKNLSKEETFKSKEEEPIQAAAAASGSEAIFSQSEYVELAQEATDSDEAFVFVQRSEEQDNSIFIDSSVCENVPIDSESEAPLPIFEKCGTAEADKCKDMKKMESVEVSKKGKFRLKSQLTKLDAKVRRAFSWEHNIQDGVAQSSEFYLEGDFDEKEGKKEDSNERLLPLLKCSPTSSNASSSPGKSPRITPKASPRPSPRASPRPTPAVEEVPFFQMCGDKETESKPQTKSLGLFDHEGNPIPPLRKQTRVNSYHEVLRIDKLKVSGETTQEKRKLSQCSSTSNQDDSQRDATPTGLSPRAELTSEEGTLGPSNLGVPPATSPSIGPLKSFLSHISKKGSSSAPVDKLDGASFSRSRSSSISSLENISSEAINCLAFADSYIKKNEIQQCPTLWVGTSLGSVIQVMIFLPSPTESRLTTPVTVAPTGTIFRLKGSILAMSFLDCNGALIPYTFESWRDANKERKLERTPTKTTVNNKMSPTNSGEQNWGDRQFVVIASDKVARVVALPSHNCVYKQIFTEVSFVVKAEIIQMKDAVCLVTYVATGHISIYSLPSLRQLRYVEFLPLDELRIARTFCFTNLGHGMYLCSPSELQKFTISSEFCKDLQELLGNLFIPCENPEPPKQGFFKGLFGGGVSQLDRDELFGESSGKASRSVAKHVPGQTAQMDHLKSASHSATSDIARAKMLALERGEKLGQLDDKTAKMMVDAESFSSTAHHLMMKYKDKKWYQL